MTKQSTDTRIRQARRDEDAERLYRERQRAGLVSSQEARDRHLATVGAWVDRDALERAYWHQDAVRALRSDARLEGYAYARDVAGRPWDLRQGGREEPRHEGDVMVVIASRGGKWGRSRQVRYVARALLADDVDLVHVRLVRSPSRASGYLLEDACDA